MTVATVSLLAQLAVQLGGRQVGSARHCEHLSGPCSPQGGPCRSDIPCSSQVWGPCSSQPGPAGLCARLSQCNVIEPAADWL